VHSVVWPERCFLPSVFLVHEDVDVLANVALLVEDPTFDARVLLLEGPENVGYGRAIELELPLTAGELGEGRTESHYGHGSILERCITA